MARKPCKIFITEEVFSRLKNEAFLSGISFSEYAGKILESGPVNAKNRPDFDPDLIKSIVENAIKNGVASGPKPGIFAGNPDQKFIENSVETMVKLLVWLKEYLVDYGGDVNMSPSAKAAGNAGKKVELRTENLIGKLRTGPQKL